MQTKQELAVIGEYLFCLLLAFVIGRFVMDSVMLEASERSWANGFFITFMRTHNLALLIFTILSIIYASSGLNEICNILRFAFLAFWISRLLFTWNKVLDPMRRLSEDNPKFVFEAATIVITGFTFTGITFEVIRLITPTSGNEALIGLCIVMISTSKISVSIAIVIICLYFLQGQWACYVPAYRGLRLTSHEVQTTLSSLLTSHPSSDLSKISEFGFVSCGGLRTDSSLFADLVARLYVSLSLQFQLITRVMAFSIFTAALGVTLMITNIVESACFRLSHDSTGDTEVAWRDTSACSSMGGNIRDLYVVAWIQEVLPIFFYLIFVSPPALLKGDIWKELRRRIKNVFEKDRNYDDDMRLTRQKSNKNYRPSDIEFRDPIKHDIRLINPVFVEVCVDSSRPMSDRLFTILESSETKQEMVPHMLNDYSLIEFHISLVELMLIDNETNVPIPALFTGRQSFVVVYIESESSQSGHKYSPSQTLSSAELNYDMMTAGEKLANDSSANKHTLISVNEKPEIDDENIGNGDDSKNEFDQEETLLEVEEISDGMQSSQVTKSFGHLSSRHTRRLSGSVIQVKPARLSMSEEANTARDTIAFITRARGMSALKPVEVKQSPPVMSTVESDGKDRNAKRVWKLLGVTENVIYDPNPSFSAGFYVPRNIPPTTRIRFDIYNSDEVIATPALICQRYISRVQEKLFSSNRSDNEANPDANDAISKVLVGQVIVSLADLERSLLERSGLKFGRSSYQNPLNSNQRSIVDAPFRYLPSAQECYYCEVVRPIPIFQFRKKIRRCGGLIRLSILPVNLAPQVFAIPDKLAISGLNRTNMISDLNLNSDDDEYGCRRVIRSFITFVIPCDFGSKKYLNQKPTRKRLTRLSIFETQPEVSNMIRDIDDGVGNYGFHPSFAFRETKQDSAKSNAFRPVMTDNLGTSLALPVPLVHRPFALRVQEEMMESDLGFIIPQLYFEKILVHRQADLLLLSNMCNTRQSCGISYEAGSSSLEDATFSEGNVEPQEFSWVSSLFEKFRDHVLSFDLRLSLTRGGMGEEAKNNNLIKEAKDACSTIDHARQASTDVRKFVTASVGTAISNTNESVLKSIKRYRFKPSRAKKKALLSHLPVNMHVQVMSSNQEFSVSPVNITSLQNGIESSLKRSDIIANSRSFADTETAQQSISQKVQFIVTCGAFTAHALEFKKGGIVQLQEKARKRAEELNCSGEVLSCLSQQPISLKNWLAILPVDQELISSLVLAQIRFDVCFSQALAVLATSFVTRLELFAVSMFGSERSKNDRLASTDCKIFDIIAEAGFFIEFESLLSTQGEENSMLEDFYGAINGLSNVSIVVMAANNSVRTSSPMNQRSSALIREAQFQISDLFKDHRMSNHVHNVQLSMGSSIPTDITLNIIIDPALLAKLPLSIRTGNPITVRPVMFSVGINEMQSVANTVGSTNLQDTINIANAHILENYYRNVLRSVLLTVIPDIGQPYDKAIEIEQDLHKSRNCRSRNSRLSNDDSLERVVLNVRSELSAEAENGRLPSSDIEIVDTLLDDIVSIVATSMGATEKHWQLLTVASDFVRMVGGCRVTSCKSGKDRTGMSVTLEEARMLRNIYGVDGDCLENLLASFRSQGVRIINAKKNVGIAKFAFNSFQRRMLPDVYQPPSNTVAKTDS